MIYAWHCSVCHHEWQAVKDAGCECDWCGAEGALLGVDKSTLPPALCRAILNKMKGL